jgi:flagellin-like protein
MKKGVSPVVATVLLIAIAVIGAVALWFWVAPMTGKPATISYAQQKFSVSKCYASTDALDIRSDSGFTLSDLNFSVIQQSDGSIICDGEYIVATIAPGETIYTTPAVACALDTSTQYILRSAQGIPDVPFTCS